MHLNMKSKEQMELEAEAYALHFQDKIKTSEKLLLFASILCHLDGDVFLYRMKSGLNDKIQEVIDRNEELKQIYDHFYIMSEQIEQYKIMLHKNNSRMLAMELENEKVTKLLTNYQQWG
jgi:hypothetical protein